MLFISGERQLLPGLLGKLKIQNRVDFENKWVFRLVFRFQSILKKVKNSNIDFISMRLTLYKIFKIKCC